MGWLTKKVSRRIAGQASQWVQQKKENEVSLQRLDYWNAWWTWLLQRQIQRDERIAE